MQLFSRLFALAAAVSPILSNAAPVSKSSVDVIFGKYIVQFMPNTDTASIAAHHNTVRSLVRRDEEVAVEREFDFGDFKGYVGSFDAATADALNALPEVIGAFLMMKSAADEIQVLLVEPDYLLHTTTLVTRRFSTFSSMPQCRSILLRLERHS
jgi:hypothetical protein